MTTTKPEITRVGAQTDTLGESPVWCPLQKALYWVDIRYPAVRRFDHASGCVDTWAMPELVGSLALADDGRLIVSLTRMLALFDPATGALTEIAAPPQVGPDQRFNDGKCDPQGRFWVGTMNNITRAPEGTLYCLGQDATLAPTLSGIRIPNSLAWSPDGRTMYFADSLVRTIYAFAFDSETGTISDRRDFAKTTAPAIPDGATVDREGCLWCAEYDGWRVTRFRPDGQIDRIIELPVQRPTSCAFGGPDLDVLYVTTATQRLTPEELANQPLAGALLALRPRVCGIPEPRYALPKTARASRP
jgi:sugar lactone lactonase YvrE